MKIKKGGFSEQDERFKIQDLGPKRTQEMICDVLPYVGQMISPEDIRDVMPEIFNPYEVIQFTQALDLMVFFDVRLLPP